MLKTNLPVFKVASESWEFEKIHELNYQTFVDEIPQHNKNDNKKLIDKYHKQNTYVICTQGKELLGMIALRDKRPLSLDQKLENLESFLPPFESILEYRLLAVKKTSRKTSVFTGIMKKSFNLALQGNYDIAVISGTTQQVRLYQHLGFKPFGPLVGKQGAFYQPMYIDIDQAKKLKETSPVLHENKAGEVKQFLFNYLPGPVSPVQDVLDASSAMPYSHRSQQFMNDFNTLCKKLCEKVKASYVYVMTGSGTLANDIVAAQLSVLSGRGLMLINGEFGERLHDQASRGGLEFDSLYENWGETFDREVIEKAIKSNNYKWLWMTHCETSTGVLNDIKMVGQMCNLYGVKLCLDCISSIGSCEVDLQGVYLATAVSGKGLASLPGLGMVFCANNVILGNGRLPKYFDLGYYKEKQGVPFTISSNAISALNAAVDKCNWSLRFNNTQKWSEEIYKELEGMGLSILASKDHRAPHITTVVLPEILSSLVVGDALEKEGVLLSYRSEYLIKKNYIQICFMGECQNPTNILSHYLRDMIGLVET